MNHTLRIHAATEGGLAEALRRELRALGYPEHDGSPYSVEYDVDVEEPEPFKPIDEASLSEVLYRSVPTDVQTQGHYTPGPVSFPEILERQYDDGWAMSPCLEIGDRVILPDGRESVVEEFHDDSGTLCRDSGWYCATELKRVD